MPQQWTRQQPPEMPLRVANLSPLPGAAIASNLGDLDLEVVDLGERTETGAAALVTGADLVLGDYAGEVAVTAAVAKAMDRARLYHHPTVGYDWVDADALTVHGIPMTTAAGLNAISVAEHVVMVTLAMLKSLLWCDREVRAGAWPQHEVLAHGLAELSGKTVGLLGFGPAARAAASRFNAFGCRVLYSARNRRAAQVEAEHGVSWRELDALVTEADVLVVLASLTAQTRGLIDAPRLAAMKPGAFLVNAARGELVDEAAVADALARGHLAGAAFDVAAREPPAADWPLRAAEHALLTPHVAGATLEARLRILQRAFEVIREVAGGRLPAGVVNGVRALRG